MKPYRTGHFTKNIAPLAEKLNSSLRVDKRLYSEDITASIAHAKMLAKCGIIPQSDALDIQKGLKSILDDIESGRLTINDGDGEDVHMLVEAELTRRIGTPAKRLHTARSRNDQVATDFRLFVRKACGKTAALASELIGVLIKRAENSLDAVMPGFTHLQKAQPITAAHLFMAYAEMFFRDVTRLNDCKKRLNVLPLGSLALAGTPYPIDRDFVKDALGFDRLSNNSIDGVSDRDFAVEYIGAAALIMVHLSRFAEEIIIFSSSDYGYFTVDEAYSTGSSIMPQKHNPDVAELVRGKSGRVFGGLTAILTVLKGLPLAYNKDLQEDKELFFDVYDTVSDCLEVFCGMVETLTINKERMLEACKTGYINATDVADYLTAERGIPFRAAYETTGAIVSYAASNKKTLEELSLDEFNLTADADKGLFEADIYQKIDIKTAVESRTSVGGPAAAAVKAAIKNLKKRMSETKEL
ncbi:MAG: argininosuccinate lyase [Clostridiales bacterium]|jgi:argininosuccinate lyase|nr:argininosuccinate lyase [Clostridiales bacterium]